MCAAAAAPAGRATARGAAAAAAAAAADPLLPLAVVPVGRGEAGGGGAVRGGRLDKRGCVRERAPTNSAVATAAPIPASAFRNDGGSACFSARSSLRQRPQLAAGAAEGHGDARVEHVAQLAEDDALLVTAQAASAIAAARALGGCYLPYIVLGARFDKQTAPPLLRRTFVALRSFFCCCTWPLRGNLRLECKKRTHKHAPRWLSPPPKEPQPQPRSQPP
jgi:hypothetical protein